MTSTPVRHHSARIALHWIVAVLVILMIPAGLIFTDFDNKPAIEGLFGAGSFDAFYNLHKGVGLTLLAIVLVRLAARRIWPDPSYARPLSPLEEKVSRIAHLALYALLVATPLIGWAAVSAYPAPLPVLGLFDAPRILPENRALSEALLEIHGVSAYALASLAAIHVAAAVLHARKGDGVMARIGVGER
jgi:cytochrome b561